MTIHANLYTGDDLDVEAENDVRIYGIFLAEDDMDIESKRANIIIEDALYAGDDIDVDARRGETQIAGQLFENVTDDVVVSVFPLQFTSYGSGAGVAAMASADEFEDEFALLAKPHLLRGSGTKDGGNDEGDDGQATAKGVGAWNTWLQDFLLG